MDWGGYIYGRPGPKHAPPACGAASLARLCPTSISGELRPDARTRAPLPENGDGKGREGSQDGPTSSGRVVVKVMRVKGSPTSCRDLPGVATDIKPLNTCI